MVLWFLIMVISVVCVGIIMRAVWQQTDDEPAASQYDVEIYRDQLDELGRDIERGVISADEAKTARAEISRKLLAAQERTADDAQEHHAVDPRLRASVAIAVAIFVPAIALGLYISQGSPGLPGQSFALRQTTMTAAQWQAQQLAEEMAALEVRLAQNPEDVQAWRLLGQSYTELRLYAKSADTYDRAIAANGPLIDLLLNRGVGLVFAENGAVSAAARLSFEAVIEQEPDNSLAHYFLGVGAAQQQDYPRAVDYLMKSLANAPPDAPWTDEANRQLTILTEQMNGAVNTPLPALEDDAPAAPLPAMVQNMVTGLAARLADNPQDLESWLLLVRSYVVMGDTTAARDALTTARDAFQDDKDALDRLTASEDAFQLRD
ncbi:MAG: c-type cytochrome biogenesis protein CcmI [Alphaproteobacteria bacterium]|nr:MAG: c-type cytochrome biogenesis protein CcmI [Alphaproteobacteria bacterium]